jgi:2-methylisocitrate lyase-like PEP mutase family enzyme
VDTLVGPLKESPMTDRIMLSASEKRAKFRAALARDSLTVMPGGCSPLFAMMAEEVGFETFFFAGSQMSAFLLGVPDVGILGLHDVVEHARHAAARANVSILLDCDTGYGNALNVHFAVHELVRSGVSGISIEDQESPKKSATSAGRRLISKDEAVGKYRAAIAARDEVDPSFVICARCDALGAEGGSFEDALERSVAYVEDGGADLVWLNSVETRSDLERACREIPAPVLVIWGGADEPEPTLEEYAQLGARIVLYPTIAASAGAQAAWTILSALAQEGQVGMARWRERIASGTYGGANVGHLLGTDDLRELEERFLPVDQQRDYQTTWGHGGHRTPTRPA